MNNKMHTKRQYERTLGHRVSRGHWERHNRAYEVHVVKDKAQIVGYDKKGEALLGPCLTLTLMRETTKCNRKVSMRDRYMPGESKRTRYLKEPAGHSR